VALLQRTICLVFISLVVGLTANAAASSFGTFSGHYTNQRLGRDQLVKLELIHERQESGRLQLRALLTLQLGGFESGEYVTYHYENVIFNVLTGAIAFNQTDQEVYLANVVLKDGDLKGDISSSTGYLGPLHLSSKATVKPDNPLVEPLGGEYVGVCKNSKRGKVAALQLYTFRSTLDTTRLGSSFGAYEGKGVLGLSTPGYCDQNGKSACTYSKIKSVSYNFFDGDLVLNGMPFSYNCTVKAGSVTCGDCSFVRASNEMKQPQTSLTVFGEDPINEVADKLKETETRALRGTYEGYIYHEMRRVFQKVRFDVTTYGRQTDSGSDLMVAVVSTVGFGDNPNESIVYKFDPVSVINPVLSPQLTLARPQDDVDPVVRINSIRGGVIRGVWNSNILLRPKTEIFLCFRRAKLSKVSHRATKRLMARGLLRI
jgi:hypothetical protein